MNAIFTKLLRRNFRFGRMRTAAPQD